MKRKPTRREKKAATRTRMATAPLSRLRAHMDLYEFQAADEILAVYRMAAGMMVERDPDLAIPDRPNPGAADEHAARRTDLVKAYPAWRRDLRDSVPLRVVDAVFFHETPLVDIDIANHWPRGTARAHLTTALHHFAVVRGNAPLALVKEWKFGT